MILHSMTPFDIYVLLLPGAVAALGLGVYWLTDWMDRRDDAHQHHPAE
jgi:hypothetical protein